MNLKLISVAAALAVSAAVAQEATATAPAQEPAAEAPAQEASTEAAAQETATDAAPAESTEAAAPESAPAAATLVEEVPAAAASSELAVESVTDTAKANFDVLRTRAYNAVGNQAAAATIADNLAKPHEMHGSKLVYLEPSLEYAALSFGEKNTYFLSFQNTTGNYGLVSAGFATAAFGVEIYGAVGKTWTLRDEPNRDYSSTSVAAGDVIGAIYSMPLGGLDLTVEASWLTTASEISSEATAKRTDDFARYEHDYWDVLARASVSNTPTQDKLISWAAGLTFTRHNLTEYTVEDEEETLRATLDSRIQIEPFFNFGLQVLKSNNARVFLGMNTNVPMAIYDEIANKDNYVRKSHLSLCILTQPNILAELALNDNWMVFGGAAYVWNVFATEYLYEGDSDINTFAMKSNTVNVDAGVRFQYKNFALEAAVNNSFFNNPLAGFNGTSIIANFGGFVNF
ncbi:MAG: hypothetical protein MJY93_04030 [Fibrobacter sp.]|nr:hypothetical protein [Fibrobacter sp.]